MKQNMVKVNHVNGHSIHFVHHRSVLPLCRSATHYEAVVTSMALTDKELAEIEKRVEYAKRYYELNVTQEDAAKLFAEVQRLRQELARANATLASIRENFST